MNNMFEWIKVREEWDSQESLLDWKGAPTAGASGQHSLMMSSNQDIYR